MIKVFKLGQSRVRGTQSEADLNKVKSINSVIREAC